MAFPLIILGDFNATVGNVTTNEIGGLDDDEENFNGTEMRKLAASARVFAPSTFPGMHHGPSPTYSSPTGIPSRIDYILLDNSFRASVGKSSVDDTIDLSIVREDHKVISVDISFKKNARKTERRAQLPAFDPDRLRDPKVMQKVADGIAAIPDVPWAVDTDSHANFLAWKLKFVLSEAAPKLKSAPKNDCISSKSWKLLENSSGTKKRMVAARRCEKKIVFRTFFDIWRIIFEKPKGDQIVQQFEVGRAAFLDAKIAEVLAHYDVHDAYVHHCCLINQNLHDLRLQAIRKDIIVSIGGDKKAKIEEIATLIPDPMNYKKSGVLWKLIK